MEKVFKKKKQSVLNISGISYSVGKQMKKTLLSSAKDSLKGKHAIYAIQKGNIIDFRKDIYKDSKELLKAIKEWDSKGFKVYSTNG